MDPIAAELEQVLAGLEPRETSIPFVSTVTATVVDGRSLGASYWGRNLREPVRFAAAIESIVKERSASFLELGPHPALGGSIARTCRQVDRPATCWLD